jgi:hypothetical protein
MPLQGSLCLSRSLGCKPDEPEECICPVTRQQEAEDAEDAGRDLVWHVLCFLSMNGWIDKYDDARFYDVSCELVLEGWLFAGLPNQSVRLTLLDDGRWQPKSPLNSGAGRLSVI